MTPEIPYTMTIWLIAYESFRLAGIDDLTARRSPQPFPIDCPRLRAESREMTRRVVDRRVRL